MCHYCGCREMPLLRDYIAEHERATNFGGEAVRAIDRGDLRRARHLLGEMATELAAHWQGEETGLFRVMAREEMFAEHIAPLVREHRELAELLATVDILEPEGQQAIRDRGVRPLRAHQQGRGRALPGLADRPGRRRVGRGDGRVARGAPRHPHDPGVSCDGRRAPRRSGRSLESRSLQGSRPPRSCGSARQAARRGRVPPWRRR